MDIRQNKIFQFLFGPSLTVIVFFMRSYRANRDRLDAWLRRKNVSYFFRFSAVLLLAIWLFMFAFSPEERRKELTNQVKQGFSEIKSSDNRDKAKPAQPVK